MHDLLTRVRSLALAYGEVLRLGNLPTVATNVLSGFTLALVVSQSRPMLGALGIAGGESAGGVEVIGPAFLSVLVMAMALYLAGMAMNAAVDASIDARERPARAIPSGRATRRGAWMWFAVLVAVGVWPGAGGPLPAPAIFAAMIGIWLWYTGLARRLPVVQVIAVGWMLAGAAAIVWMVAAPLLGDTVLVSDNTSADSIASAKIVRLDVSLFRMRGVLEVGISTLAALVLYNLVHRRSLAAIWFLGVCRAGAFALGAWALGGDIGARVQRFPGELTILAALPAVSIGLYTVFISVWARDETDVPGEPHRVCPQCGYPVAPETTTKCPECGDDFEQHPALARRSTMPLRQTTVMVLVCAMLFAGVLCSAGLGLLRPSSSAPMLQPRALTVFQEGVWAGPATTKQLIWFGAAMAMAAGTALLFARNTLRIERVVRSHPTRVAGGIASWIAGFCLYDAFLCAIFGSATFSAICLALWWLARRMQRVLPGS